MQPYCIAQDEVFDNDSATEASLMAKYSYLVKRACAHLRSQVSSCFSFEDFEQLGMMGLLEAIRRYGEPDASFESFAFKRIRGTILDELRRQDWRPRQLRQAAHHLNHAQRDLYNQLGRMPSERELAEKLEIPVEEVWQLVYANQAEQMQCLDDWLTRETAADHASPAQQRFELKRTLAHALNQLAEREQLLLTLYYQHELNMKEIAQVLKLTESRVCQLHKAALASLNSILEREQ